MKYARKIPMKPTYMDQFHTLFRKQTPLPNQDNGPLSKHTLENGITIHELHGDNINAIKITGTINHCASFNKTYAARMEKDQCFLYTCFEYGAQLPGEPCLIHDDIASHFLSDFLQYSIWAGYGGKDVDMYVTTHAHQLDLNGAKMIANRAEKQKLKFCSQVLHTYSLPVIYVLPSTYYPHNFDAEHIACKTAGFAHTIVAANPVVVDKIGIKDVPVTIFYPNGLRVEYDSEDTGVTNNTVINDLYEQISQVYDQSADQFYVATLTPPTDDTHVTLNVEPTTEKPAKEKKHDEEIERLKAELAHTKAELTETKNNLHAVKTRLNAMHGNLAAAKAAHGTNGILFDCTDTELYEGEIKDVVLRVLRKEYESINADAKSARRRKCDILKNLLENNSDSGKYDEIKAIITGAFKNGRLDASDIASLENNGFTVENTKGGHFKITYGDNRYVLTFASSSSDHRSGENMISDTMNMLFR